MAGQRCVTHNVVVLPWAGVGGPTPDRQVARFPGTDVWHKTFRYRADFHRSYVLSPNDQRLVGDEGNRPEESTATLHPDPLNRHPSALMKDDEHPVAERLLPRYWTFSTVALLAGPVRGVSMRRSAPGSIIGS